MIKINILTKSSYNNFLHQLDKNEFENEISFFENSKLDIEWDMVVVYEGINFTHSLRVRKGDLIFISGEPPMSSVYPEKFLKQFHYLITSHPNLNHPNNILYQQALNWHFGFDFITKKYKYNYESLANLKPPHKTRGISIISSSKKMMPGHNNRMKLIEILKNKFFNDIDFFGKDTNPVADKAEAILPYRFHICIENSFIDNYWTEKFADPILGYSIPIYIGCTNIKEYFDEDFYYNFDISDLDGVVDLINRIKVNPEKYYNSKIESLIEARKKLLNEYNIFSLLSNFVNSKIKSSEFTSNIEISPSHHYFNYRFLLYKLRMKRFFYKFYLSYKNRR